MAERVEQAPSRVSPSGLVAPRQTVGGPKTSQAMPQGRCPGRPGARDALTFLSASRQSAMHLDDDRRWARGGDERTRHVRAAGGLLSSGQMLDDDRRGRWQRARPADQGRGSALGPATHHVPGHRAALRGGARASPHARRVAEVSGSRRASAPRRRRSRRRSMSVATPIAPSAAACAGGARRRLELVLGAVRRLNLRLLDHAPDPSRETIGDGHLQLAGHDAFADVEPAARAAARARPSPVPASPSATSCSTRARGVDRTLHAGAIFLTRSASSTGR